jgi:hypothetical protein
VGCALALETLQYLAKHQIPDEDFFGAEGCEQMPYVA